MGPGAPGTSGIEELPTRVVPFTSASVEQQQNIAMKSGVEDVPMGMGLPT